MELAPIKELPPEPAPVAEVSAPSVADRTAPSSAPLDVVTTDDGVKRYPLFYAGEVRLVPLEEVNNALDAGYRETSQQEIDHQEAVDKYEARNPNELGRDITAGLIGAGKGALAVPALAANLIPGVDGESGGSLFSKMVKGMYHLSGESVTQEELEKDLRIMAEGSPGSDLFGLVAGELVTSRGIGTGAKAMSKGVNLLRGTTAARVGGTAENIAGHISFANEQAFNQNQELSSEMIAMSTLGALAGPMAFSMGSRAASGIGKGIAGKIDASRLAGYQKTVRAGKGAGRPPTRLADLFASPEARRRASIGLIDEAAGASSALAKTAERVGGRAGRFAGQRAAGSLRRGLGMGGDMRSIPGAVAMIGGFMADSVGGYLMGGLVGKVVQKYGAPVAGIALNRAANNLRSLSARAANGALKKKKSFTPKMVAMDISKQAYRARLTTILQDGQEYTKEVLGDEVAFVDAIGESYGELGKVNPQMVGAMTNQHLRSAAYLQEHMPETRPRSAMQPYGARTEAPTQELESYARRMRAVQNPLAILNDLEQGALHPDTVDAVQKVYPSMYRDMQMEIVKVLSEKKEPLTRKEEMQFDRFFGDRGSVYAAYRPDFQARIAAINKEVQEAEQQNNRPPSKQGQGGGSNPSIAQSMRTTSQRLASGKS